VADVDLGKPADTFREMQFVGIIIGSSAGEIT
jgi:hypothetical protein